MRWKDGQEWSLDKNTEECYVAYFKIKHKPPQPEQRCSSRSVPYTSSQADGTIRKRHFFLLKAGSTKSKSLLPSSSVSSSLLAVITNSCPITMQITGYRAVTCVCKGQASLCFRVSLLIPVAARGLKPIGRWCHGFTYR